MPFKWLIPASANDKGQTRSTGEACGCHFAWEHVTGKEVNPGQLTQKFASFNYSDGRKDESVDAETLNGPKRTQIEFRGPS